MFTMFPGTGNSRVLSNCGRHFAALSRFSASLPNALFSVTHGQRDMGGPSACAAVSGAADVLPRTLGHADAGREGCSDAERDCGRTVS